MCGARVQDAAAAGKDLGFSFGGVALEFDNN